jgi:hypothetical protein
MPHLTSFHRQRIAVLACVLLFHVPVASLTQPPSEPKRQALPKPESVKKSRF